MSDATARALARPSAAIALDLLDRAQETLLEACRTTVAASRYLQAQLAALRAAAAMVAARSLPDSQAGPRSLWDLLPVVAPELTEWAEFFAVPTGQRTGIERGQVRVSARAADDLLRQAETFVALVARALGLPSGASRADLLFPLARG